MTVVADVIVPPDAFILSGPLASVPAVHLELVGTIGESSVPYLWASGDRLGQFVAAVADEPSIRAVETAFDRRSNGGSRECLLRLEWDETHPATGMPPVGGIILGGSYTQSSGWELAIVLPRKSAPGAISWGNDSLEVRQISSARRALDGDSHGLTSAQLEAVTVAYDNGYFAVPRERTLTDIADELDVSVNALSARLRRGLSTLVGNTVKSGERSDST